MLKYDPKTDFFSAIGREGALDDKRQSLCRITPRATADRIQLLESTIRLWRSYFDAKVAPMAAYRALRAERILYDQLIPSPPPSTPPGSVA